MCFLFLIFLNRTHNLLVNIFLQTSNIAEIAFSGHRLPSFYLLVFLTPFSAVSLLSYIWFGAVLLNTPVPGSKLKVSPCSLGWCRWLCWQIGLHRGLADWCPDYHCFLDEWGYWNNPVEKQDNKERVFSLKHTHTHNSVMFYQSAKV